MSVHVGITTKKREKTWDRLLVDNFHHHVRSRKLSSHKDSITYFGDVRECITKTRGTLEDINKVSEVLLKRQNEKT